tara:strand:- start:109 stop:909 length:801 start_codon:yes stop_codon:yes gene_type:complete
MVLVSLEKVDFNYFNKKILKEIHFTVKENESILLLGGNGAGKSTMLRLIAGIHIAYQFNEFNVLGTDRPLDQNNGLAYLGNRWVRQSAFSGQSAYTGDIRVGDMMKQWQMDNIERRDELVEVLGIDLDWRMHEVSHGQRKRVQIMIALLKPFRLVIIDEFLSELDIVVRDKMFHYLKKECKLRNGSIIYATHVFDDLDRWMDCVVYISNGTCEDKIDMKTFKQDKSLYQAVKEKLLQDKEMEIEALDTKLLGGAGGYTNGRLLNFV